MDTPKCQIIAEIHFNREVLQMAYVALTKRYVETVGRYDQEQQQNHAQTVIQPATTMPRQALLILNLQE